ncbi:MAG: glycosyltransferase [Acidimicrobiia bacterium]
MHAGEWGSTGPIVVIEDRVPNVGRGSGDPRAARIAQAIAERFPRRPRLWLSPTDLGAAEFRPVLDDLGYEVFIGDVRAELARRAGSFDVVVMARPHNWEAFHDAVDTHQPQARRIYDAESLYHVRIDREARLASGERRMQLIEASLEQYHQERCAMEWADAVMCVANDAVAMVEMVSPGTPTAVVSHAVDVPSWVRPLNQRGGVVMFGGFLAGPGGPNEDAAIVTASQIAPLLPEPVVIAGADPTPAVEMLANEHVYVVGPVVDSIDYLSRYRVHVCPLRIGAGLKLRIVDSAAAGTPVATTPVGAENLGFDTEMMRLMVGLSPADLVELTHAFLRDDARWWAAHEMLRSLARERYTQGTLATAVAAVFDAVSRVVVLHDDAPGAPGNLNPTQIPV